LPWQEEILDTMPVYEVQSDSSDKESLDAAMDSVERELFKLAMMEMINLKNDELKLGQTI
jgi:hypothetical protein